MEEEKKSCCCRTKKAFDLDDPESVRRAVEKGYQKVVQGFSSGDTSKRESAKEISKAVGYTEEDLKSVPEEANMGLGCGNPVALANIKEGQTVVDLGCGGGFDSFLAARRVKESGHVIGIDMTPEMIRLARKNAEKGGYKNVEFRIGRIEQVPVEDESVDVVLSNCVINLSPEKPAVFSEAFRILRPGGLLAISDIVLLKEISQEIKSNVAALVGCIAGAEIREKYLDLIKNAGFENIQIVDETFMEIDSVSKDSVNFTCCGEGGCCSSSESQSCCATTSKTSPVGSEVTGQLPIHKIGMTKERTEYSVASSVKVLAFKPKSQ